MKITIRQAIDWFSDRVYHEAHKRPIPGMEPEDIAHELFIKIAEHDWKKERTMCRVLKRYLPISPARVNRFLPSAAIDLLRVRSSPRGEKRTEFMGSDSLPDRVTKDNQDYRLIHEELWEFLTSRLTPDDLRMMILWYDPPEIAVQSMIEAGRKRLSMSDLAKALGVSKATVSRATTKARVALVDALAERRQDD